MTDVFVERRLARPHTVADLQEIGEKMQPCLPIHRVTWFGSLLSADATEMFCHFRGPDLESVRIAMRQSGAPPGNVWSCRYRNGPDVSDDDLARVRAIVIHTFERPAEFGVRVLDDEVEIGCLELHRVRLLRSYLSGDGLRMVALYQAPDAESVRMAQRRAGQPADRVVAVRRFAA